MSGYVTIFLQGKKPNVAVVPKNWCSGNMKVKLELYALLSILRSYEGHLTSTVLFAM
jgi:hypothetical protein